MPLVALGTWQLTPEKVPEVVGTALDAGYRAIDTAWIYGNEPAIGPVVQKFKPSERKNLPKCDHMCVPTASAVAVSASEFKASFSKPHNKAPSDDREVFVTSKIWVEYFTKEGVKSQVQEHLKNFGRDSVDLMLLHWPGHHTSMLHNPSEEMMKSDQFPIRKECWMALEEEYHAGRIRAIGVSNYLVKHLEQLLTWIEERKAAGDTKAMYPMVDQIELSVFCQPSEKLEKLCMDHNILITSYSTMGGGKGVKKNMSDPELKKIADNHHVDNAAVMLRWALQRGFTILPKSQTPSRVVSNFHQVLCSLELTSDEMKKLNQMNRDDRQLMNPDDVN